MIEINDSTGQISGLLEVYNGKEETRFLYNKKNLEYNNIEGTCAVGFEAHDSLSKKLDSLTPLHS